MLASPSPANPLLSRILTLSRRPIAVLLRQPGDRTLFCHADSRSVDRAGMGYSNESADLNGNAGEGDNNSAG